MLSSGFSSSSQPCSFASLLALIQYSGLLEKRLTLRLAARPSGQLLLSESGVVPLLVLEALNAVGPDVGLGLDLFAFDVAFSGGFIALGLQQTYAHSLELVLVALEHVKAVDVSVSQAGDVGTANRVAFLRNDTRVIAVLNTRTLVIVEDGRSLSDGLDVVSADCGSAEDDVVEDFLGHQGAFRGVNC